MCLVAESGGGLGSAGGVPVMRRSVPVSMMCARCGDPFKGHVMFSERFPETYPGESRPLVARSGRLVAADRHGGSVGASWLAPRGVGSTVGRSGLSSQKPPHRDGTRGAAAPERVVAEGGGGVAE